MTEIRWEAWGEAAFERARREDKPILLSISAVWCHWCHVMDHTTYGVAAIAQKIHENYVPVRVDNDVRPDVNARYNMGGWPTTAFLTPDGITITGATYLPPDQMTNVLDEIQRFYRTNKDEIAARGEQLRGRARTYEPARNADITEAMPQHVVAQLAHAYDPLYGGFGEAPKFPQPEALEALLLEHRVTGAAEPLEMVRNTLAHMAAGGTYDHEEGGFFRYSTTRDWSVPHFEKMSEDHAGLLRVLAQLSAFVDEPWIVKTLRSATAYVRAALRDPQTGFFAGSQDADEAYYAKPLAERRAMKVPFIDRRSYANWTAQLAGAFLAVGNALHDDTFAQEAVQTLDAMHERLRDADGLLYHLLAPGESASVRGLLGDQGAYLRALLDAHEYTGEARFLERAQQQADLILAHFAAENGGFYDSACFEQPLGNLVIADRPIGNNGTVADALLRLGALAGDQRYRESAERTLLLYAKTYEQAGSFAATYVRAARRYMAAETTVRIVGDIAATQPFRDAALERLSPLTGILTIAPHDAARFGLPATTSPTAYVCNGTRCGPPVSEPSAF
jgi:hypothetical protein